MSEFRALSVLGMLGYGIPAESLERGLAMRPDMIGADAGSTDAGPHKLGRGIHDVSRTTTKRDIAMMLTAGRKAGVPVVVGSAGGSGAKPHMDWTWDIVKEIADERRMTLRVAIVHADIAIERVRAALHAGKVSPLGAAPALDDEALDATTSIVGQMGTEPIAAALEGGADFVLAGRSCDAAIFAAPAIRAGADPGLAWHMGEILECGAMCADPGSANDCMIGTIEPGRFTLEPTNPARVCTPLSVAAHSLYERSRPSQSEGPGHLLDLSQSRFEALDDRRVRVSNSRFVRTDPLRIKLEGAKPMGFRTIVIGGVRDPIGIARLDETMEAVKSATARFFGDEVRYTLRFVVYGRDGVMGERDPLRHQVGHEVGLLLDVVAPTQDAADAVCAFARSQLQHYHYQGIRSTAANIAFPTAPSDIRCGSIFEFSVYHLMEVASPTELFPVEYRTLGA